MKTLVVGMGVQGNKRMRIAGDDFVASVDPVWNGADFKDLRDVPLERYDAAMLCIPDEPKIELLTYLAENGKHALVEKPLFADSTSEIEALQNKAIGSGSVFYSAYNHRFEPHFMRMNDLIKSGDLGRIYSCRMFYGNGTARLVRESAWRDQGAGVWPDLGSHLLDTLHYWFGPQVVSDIELVSANCFENLSPDHVVVASTVGDVRIELEMTMLMWRNHFTCDVLAEAGTAHISSLCKWGPSEFVRRTRVLPSGRPPENAVTLVEADPTWALEYEHFKALVASGKNTDFSKDMLLNDTLQKISADIRTKLAQRGSQKDQKS